MQNPDWSRAGRGFHGLVKLFIGLGALIFLASAAAVWLALPYVVLERGFTQVIVGTVGMNAGLVLIGIGVVLREIRKGVSALTSAAPDGAMSVADNGAALASVATGAAATGLGMAASGTAEEAPDKLDQLELDWSKSAATAAVDVPSLNLPRLELPPFDMTKLDFPKLDSPNFDPPAIGRTAPANDADDVPGQDEFTRLRAALSDQLERPNVLHGSDQDEPDVTEAATAADLKADEDSDAISQAQTDASAGPVSTDPVSTDPVSTDPEPADDATHRPDDAAAALSTQEGDTALPQAAADDSMPEAQAPKPAPATVSDEGIIRAYQVGDTAFTVYGDGTIRAETSEGEFTFDSMDEVRAFLAREKLKLRG